VWLRGRVLSSVDRPRANGERLTARKNTTRQETVWELNETTQKRELVEREVSNHRVAVDWTFSLEKDKSVYLARTCVPLTV
jgi:hypothetical protein